MRCNRDFITSYWGGAASLLPQAPPPHRSSGLARPRHLRSPPPHSSFALCSSRFGWSLERAAQEAPGADDEHGGHEGEDREDREAREEEDAEGQDLAVDERAEEGAPEGAEAADDHDHEGLHDHLGV